MMRFYSFSLFVALALAALLAASCSRRPKGILSEKEMVALLTDITVAETYQQGAMGYALPDSIRYNLGEIVLRDHDVDRAVFDSTLAWYGRNLDEYVLLYQKVDKNLQKRIRNESGGLAVDVEEDNIWNMERHYWFTPLSDDRAVIFEIPGETMAKGERLQWSAYIASSPNTDMLLGIDYKDGSSTYLKRTFRGERKLMLELLSDTSRIVSRIFGTLHVDRAALPAWADSIKLLKLPFDSANYHNMSLQKNYYGPRKRTAGDDKKDKADKGDKEDKEDREDKSRADKVIPTPMPKANWQESPAITKPNTKPKPKPKVSTM